MGFSVVTDLETETCPACGMLFAMPADYMAKLRRSHRDFYCPAGHLMSYQAKSEAEALRDRLDAERRRAERAEQRVAEVADQARAANERAERERRRANGYKGHATRITKRAKAGVCPCCKRTFAQLARHMAAKHPEFTPLDIEQSPPPGVAVQ